MSTEYVEFEFRYTVRFQHWTMYHNKSQVSVCRCQNLGDPNDPVQHELRLVTADSKSQIPLFRIDVCIWIMFNFFGDIVYLS